MDLWVCSKSIFAVLTLFEKTSFKSKVTVSASHEQCIIFNSVISIYNFTGAAV